METFAADLKRLSNGYVTNAVLDQTGLKGSWDFELRFTQRALLGLAASMDGASATSLSDAIDKQLGLKLEERDIPTPVLVVEQVNAKPTANSPDVAAKLPPPPPMEFEVADIKPVDPNARRTGAPQIVSPGGRVNLTGIPLKLVIMLAWSLPTIQNDQIIGAPKWLDSASFDIIGKLPSDLAPANGATVPLQDLGPALQALLIDRFKMKVHFEDRLGGRVYADCGQAETQESRSVDPDRMQGPRKCWRRHQLVRRDARSRVQLSEHHDGAVRGPASGDRRSLHQPSSR